LTAAWDRRDAIGAAWNVASDLPKHPWGGLDSNQRPADYESAALTN
jgi:hypothetical protein